MIVGGTSGIGLECARQYAQRGDRVLVCGRNETVLKDLERNFPESVSGMVLDIRDSSMIIPVFEAGVKVLGGLDLLIMSSSIGINNPKYLQEAEEDLIHTNVRGYTLILNAAVKYFLSVGGGHLAGITSIAQFIASKSPGYSASKSFEAKYLEGLRIKTAGRNIHISEIIPGFVQTPMISGRSSMFWVVPVAKAASQIISGLDKGRKTLYISRRWRFVRWLTALVPRWVIRQIMILADSRN